MKNVEININEKNVLEILKKLLVELEKINETSNITVKCCSVWGESKLKNKRGGYRESIKNTKGKDSEIKDELLQSILVLLKRYNHELKTEIIAVEQKKYYAIKVGRTVRDKIVLSWDECKREIEGFSSIYKRFFSEEEAVAYLESIDIEEVMRRNQIALERKILEDFKKLNKESREKVINNLKSLK